MSRKRYIGNKILKAEWVPVLLDNECQQDISQIIVQDLKQQVPGSGYMISEFLIHPEI